MVLLSSSTLAGLLDIQNGVDPHIQLNETDMENIKS